MLILLVRTHCNPENSTTNKTLMLPLYQENWNLTVWRRIVFCNVQFSYSKYWVLQLPALLLYYLLTILTHDNDHNHIPMGTNLYLFCYILQSSEFDTNRTLLHTSSMLHNVVFIYLICWLIDITCITTVVLQYLSLVGSFKIWYIYAYIQTYIPRIQKFFENDSGMSNKSYTRHTELHPLSVKFWGWFNISS
jgi:hypothetical protein